MGRFCAYREQMIARLYAACCLVQAVQVQGEEKEPEELTAKKQVYVPYGKDVLISGSMPRDVFQRDHVQPELAWLRQQILLDEQLIVHHYPNISQQELEPKWTRLGRTLHRYIQVDLHEKVFHECMPPLSESELKQPNVSGLLSQTIFTATQSLSRYDHTIRPYLRYLVLDLTTWTLSTVYVQHILSQKTEIENLIQRYQTLSRSCIMKFQQHQQKLDKITTHPPTVIPSYLPVIQPDDYLFLENQEEIQELKVKYQTCHLIKDRLESKQKRDPSSLSLQQDLCPFYEAFSEFYFSLYSLQQRIHFLSTSILSFFIPESI